MGFKYDGIIKIATASSRCSIQWKNQQILWSDFAIGLKTVKRTNETQADYRAMSKARRDEIKDVGGFVGGVLRNGRRKTGNVVERTLLTLDLDSVPVGSDPWVPISLIYGNAAVLYSTHSHSPQAPRLRLVMPFSRPVSPEEYEAIARRIAEDIGINICDDTTYEPHRLMYWASASIDGEFRCEVQDGPWLDVEDQLSRYSDWHDVTQWPISSRKLDEPRRLADKQGDPTAKEGWIGAFCRVYSVEEAIDQFLPDKYVKCGKGRYTYTGGSTSGGLIVYDDGKFAYSHHSTDPACGRLCNAFDLVRIHLYGEEDESIDPKNTDMKKLPSFKRMLDLASTNPEVQREYKAEQFSSIIQLFADDDDKTAWINDLEINPKTGKPAATIQNVITILQCDSRLKDSFYYDEFLERPVICGNLPWESISSRMSTSWTDIDDAGLRNLLEHDYKIDNAPKIRDAIDQAINSRKRHPVREYLRSLTWDGVHRAETLFIDYLGAEDNKYTREVTRKALIGAVARILSPGCKHDHILVLVGPQGCYKSTTLRKLGKEWFSDSLYTMNGKEAYEQLQGHWIIELAEMAAMRKSEIEQIKQFVSKQEDSFRAAYARRTQTHPRQCAFFGSTNNDEFLRDPTGARRFWPVKVTNVSRERADCLTEDIVDQIWAEAVTFYDSGETWYLTAEGETLAHKAQIAHTEDSGIKGQIVSFLNTPIPIDWEKYNLDRRLLFWNGGFGGDPTATKLRTQICVSEIWQELFQGDIKEFSPQKRREIVNILNNLDEGH